MNPRRLRAATAACVVLGWISLVTVWWHPDSELAAALVTAAGWPWLLLALLGVRVWLRGRFRSADPHEHFLSIYAAGTVLAILTGSLVAGIAGWALPLPGWLALFGPLGTVLSAMALAAIAAGLSFGILFPALLPLAAPAVSTFLLRGRRPSRPDLLLASVVTAIGWLAAAAVGLALAQI